MVKVKKYRTPRLSLARKSQRGVGFKASGCRRLFPVTLPSIYRHFQHATDFVKLYNALGSCIRTMLDASIRIDRTVLFTRSSADSRWLQSESTRGNFMRS